MSDNSKIVIHFKKKRHGGLHYKMVASVPKYNRNKVNKYCSEGRGANSCFYLF